MFKRREGDKGGELLNKNTKRGVKIRGQSLPAISRGTKLFRRIFRGLNFDLRASFLEGFFSIKKWP